MREPFGSYEIYEELGAGGIASVHLARTRAVKNPVALVRLHLDGGRLDVGVVLGLRSRARPDEPVRFGVSG